jgi:hypothetical protein
MKNFSRCVLGAVATVLAAGYVLASYSLAWNAFALTAEQSLVRLITS